MTEPSPERTTGSMRYVKLFVMECLEGTIRFDFEPDERGVWYDLIILGGRMRVKGLIAAGPGQPYPRRWIAGTLNIEEELLDRTLQKCINTGRVQDNKDGLRIINWPKYQSEYDRQAPYRKAKRARGQPEHNDDPEKYYKGKYAICRDCGRPKSQCVCEEKEKGGR